MADPAGDSDVLPAQDKVKFTEAGAPLPRDPKYMDSTSWCTTKQLPVDFGCFGYVEHVRVRFVE